jgi:hypothetical protein
MLQLVIALLGALMLLLGVIAVWYLGSYAMLGIVGHLFPLTGRKRKR